MDVCTTTKALSVDELLLPYLRARDERQSEYQLDRLLREYAEPVITGVLRRKTGRGSSRCAGRNGVGGETPGEREAQDAYSEAVARTICRLRDCKGDPARAGIQDFRGYVAVTAFRACSRGLRERCPRRESLKSRVRYALTREPDLAHWEDAEGRLCGRSEWRTEEGTGAATPAQVHAVREVLRASLPLQMAREEGEHPGGFGGLLRAVLDGIGRPIEMNDLLALLADLLAVRDRAVEVTPTGSSEDGGGDPFERLADGGVSVAEAVDRRAYLACLWREIRALPQEYRAALLLNLRDAQGRGVIALFPLAGVATMAEISAALEIPEAALCRLWECLPLDDAAIAERIGSGGDRQRVSNLRMVARRRLARRMAAWEEDA